MVSTTSEHQIIHDQISTAKLQLKKWEPEPWPLTEYANDQEANHALGIVQQDVSSPG